MSDGFTLDNISDLRAMPLETSAGWQVTFQSDNDGMHHQLYLNGRLVAATDGVEQRQFLLGPEAGAGRIAIVAVDEEYRSTDLANDLPDDHGRPAWVKVVQFVRDIATARGVKVSLLTDHTTGQLDPVPVASRHVWPPWTTRWAWGEDLFGPGSFGYDGTLAPGAGQGAFSAGHFGFDADMASLSATLLAEGTHQLMLHATGLEGQVTQVPLDQMTVSPPPAAPAAIAVTAYDSQTNLLTLQID